MGITMHIKQLLREPLLHFLLLGAGIFIYYSLSRDIDDIAVDNIVVTRNQQAQLSANFQRTWMRAPNTAELTTLIENYVREEVFYREALALGLDRNDPLVRRRMQMKLEFMLDDLASLDVSDDELTVFLANNKEKFVSDVQVSFQQISIKAPANEADIDAMLARLNNGGAASADAGLSLLPAGYDLATQTELSNRFGASFANDIVVLEPGVWLGPLQSAYGAHLVKVTERVDAAQGKLADIRAIVAREYLVQKSKQQKEQTYQQLRKNYAISVESIDNKVIVSVTSGELNDE